MSEQSDREALIDAKAAEYDPDVRAAWARVMQREDIYEASKAMGGVPWRIVEAMFRAGYIAGRLRGERALDE